MIGYVDRDRGRWCRECGHEAHAPGRCVYRMSNARMVELAARGRPIRDLQCDCEGERR